MSAAVESLNSLKPLISVIIPVYNSGASAVQLASSLATSADHLEIILVDDGSTDDSLALLTEELSDTDNVTILHQSHSGPSAARNLGLDHASGQYISFIDSDDSVLYDFFSKLEDALNIRGQKNALAVCGFRYHRVQDGTTHDEFADAPASRKHGDTDQAYILRLFAADGRLHAIINKLFRAEIIREHNIRFDKSLSYGEDTKFVLDYLARSNYCIGFVPAPLYRYNYNRGLASQQSADWRNWQPIYQALKDFLGPRPSFRERWLLRKVRRHWRRACFHAKLRRLKGSR